MPGSLPIEFATFQGVHCSCSHCLGSEVVDAVGCKIYQFKPEEPPYSQVRNSWRQHQNRPDFKTSPQKYIFHILQPNHIEFHRSKCSIFETCLWQSLRTKECMLEHS